MKYFLQPSQTVVNQLPFGLGSGGLFDMKSLFLSLTESLSFPHCDQCCCKWRSLSERHSSVFLQTPLLPPGPVEPSLVGQGVQHQLTWLIFQTHTHISLSKSKVKENVHIYVRGHTVLQCQEMISDLFRCVSCFLPCSRRLRAQMHR